MSVIEASFVKIGGTLADGTLRLVVDVEPRNAHAAFALFHAPGTPMALAALTNATPAPAEEEPLKGGELAKLAGRWCNNEENFWDWANQSDMTLTPITCKDDAKRFICNICLVHSRRLLDHDDIAAQRFHIFIREPFNQWRTGK